jgi:hypothetical protein
MSCIIITWYCRDHILVMYDIKSGITIGDALSLQLIIGRSKSTVSPFQYYLVLYWIRGCYQQNETLYWIRFYFWSRHNLAFYVNNSLLLGRIQKPVKMPQYSFSLNHIEVFELKIYQI